MRRERKFSIDRYKTVACPMEQWKVIWASTHQGDDFVPPICFKNETDKSLTWWMAVACFFCSVEVMEGSFTTRFV